MRISNKIVENCIEKEVEDIEFVADRLYTTTDEKVIAQLKFFNEHCRIYKASWLEHSKFNVEILDAIVTNKKHIKHFINTNNIISPEKMFEQFNIIKTLEQEFLEYVDVPVFCYEGGN